MKIKSLLEVGLILLVHNIFKKKKQKKGPPLLFQALTNLGVIIIGETLL